MLVLKNKKLTKIGGSLGFIIEKAYFDSEQMKEEGSYTLILEEQTTNDEM